MAGSIVRAASLVTSTSSIDPTQSFYHREALLRAKYADNYGKWADTVQLPAKRGKTIIMRRWAHLAVALSPLTEGVPPTGKTPTLTDYSAAVYQFGDFIALSDYADETGVDDYQRHWAGLLGEQAGYSIDAVNRDVATAGTTIVYSNGAARTDVTTVIDGNDLDRAMRTLANNGAQTILGGNGGSDTVNSYPTMPAYPAVTLPDVLFTLQNISGFKWASDYKGAIEGEIGRYKQIAFFLSPDPDSLTAGGKKFIDAGGTASSYVKSTGGTSADVYTIMLFGKHGFTTVPLNAGSTKMYRKELGSAGSADPIDQVMTMGWKNNSARLRTNESWLCRIEVAAEL